MSWLDKVLDAIKTAAVIDDRVDRLAVEAADLARELREIDRRVARLEGIIIERGSGGEGRKSPRLPP
jgi:hypothetical protein